VLDIANAVKYPGQSSFSGKSLAPYKVNGKEGGTFKTQDNLSFMRVYGAGHEVPYYRKSLEV
jgi:carboxypeptidase D